MSRRGENIYKRKDKRWEARILISPGKYRYLYGTSYNDVKQKKTVFLSKQNNARSEELFSDVLETWLIDHSIAIKPSTYENYYYILHKHVFPYFKNQNIQSINERCILDYQKSISNHSSAMQRKILTILKMAMKNSICKRYNTTSLCDIIKIPKNTSKHIDIFTLEEQNLIEKSVRMNVTPRSLGILLCLYSGIRLGEICALKWNCVNLTRGFMEIKATITRINNFDGGSKQKTKLVISEPKTIKSTRIIPMPDFLVNMLNSYTHDQQLDNKYFLSNDVEPIEPRTYQRYFYKLQKEIGIRKRNFHVIRHTFASRTLYLGVDIKTLSELLGHSSVITTLNVYSHTLMETKIKAMRKLDQFYNDLSDI